MDNNKMTPEEYFGKKLSETGIWSPMLNSLMPYADILTLAGDDILTYGWYDPNMLTDEVKEKIDKRFEEGIEVSNGGKTVVIRKNGENARAEITISGDQDNVELIEKNAKVSVEKNSELALDENNRVTVAKTEKDSQVVIHSASTKRMVINRSDSKIKYINSSEIEVPREESGEINLDSNFVSSPLFLEEYDEYGSEMNDYKKSMSVSNRKINLIGKDGKLKILDLTQKLAEKILSTFKKSDKSTVKAVEEELGKQENVQTQAQEEVNKDDNEER